MRRSIPLLAVGLFAAVTVACGQGEEKAAKADAGKVERAPDAKLSAAERKAVEEKLLEQGYTREQIGEIDKGVVVQLRMMKKVQGTPEKYALVRKGLGEHLEPNLPDTPEEMAAQEQRIAETEQRIAEIYAKIVDLVDPTKSDAGKRDGDTQPLDSDGSKSEPGSR